MKRILCFILCAVLLLGLSACGKNKNNNARSDSSSESVSAAEQEEVFKPDWVLAPSVKAARIFPLPQTDFNEASNHYDVSFGGLYAFESEGKIGFIDLNGQVVIEPKYATAETCTCTDKYIVTAETENGTVNYRFSSSNLTPIWSKAHNCQNANAYKYTWDSAAGRISTVYLTTGKAAPVKKVYSPEVAEIVEGGKGTGKFTVVTGGTAVGAADYTGAGIFTDGIAAVEKDGKWGYVNAKGEEIIPFEYDAVKGYSAVHDKDHDTPYESSEGYLTVVKDGKYGILKTDGTAVVPCQFAGMTTVHSGRVLATENGTDWGVLCIDKKLSDGIAPSKSTESTTTAAAKKSTTQSSKSSSKAQSSAASGTSKKTSAKSSAKASTKASTKASSKATTKATTKSAAKTTKKAG